MPKVEKEAFVEVSNEVPNEPLTKTVNVEIINISDSPPEKGQIEEVFKVAQENIMINWRNLAKEGEKVKV